ncbi:MULTISPECIES: cell wall-binding repeat-containing protein [unclassified Planococcus (in: firmicutes)]|uniref:cell wall-binding repeat-containing protein n=1 Tax=unclassified Planococcus (in: firmicutes) TaxID=2662419 RepID=UPI0011AE311A|nr:MULTISPECIES: cell wall-binding repeat-containing protein [unclassified Planococcus (in: firmicutes)]
MNTSKKFGITVLTGAAVFHAAGLASADEAEQTDRVIVTLEAGTSSQALTGETVDALNINTANEVVTVEVPKGQSVEDYIEQLGMAPGVANVEADHLLQTTAAPNDPYYSFQYHHEMIGSERAWARTMGTTDVLVAVLDNGFDLDHPDLNGQIVSSYATATSMSEDDHGTHVAGIIGAAHNNRTYGAGVAPDAGLLAIDVFEGERAYSSDVIEGIYYAADAGADVINMSLGNYFYNESYQTAIDYAHERGVLVIASSGNDYTDNTHYPSGYENVMAVGSTDRADRFSGFSNYGADQDITAPGTGIWSTIAGGSFSSMSGTSMASPVVAGIAALVKANEPDLSNEEIAQRLYDTSVDLGAAGKDPYFGHGRIDAEAALMIFDIEQPAVSDVYDSSVEITGTLNQAVEDAVITVDNEDGEIARQEDYTGAGKFSLAIPKQAAGRVLTLTVRDRYGNQSEALEIVVKETQPEELPGRISGIDRYQTAIAISQTGWESADTVVIATAGNFPDALAGGPLAYLEDAPILLTRSGELHSETALEIERLGAEKAIILGGSGAVSDAVEAELKTMNLATERIGGETRYETATLIAEKMGSRRAVVANGLNFPDVLSVSPYAAKNGIPILLTRSDALPKETASALERYTSSLVIGGTGVVSEDVFGHLPNPERFGGKTRYDTGLEVATRLPLGDSRAFIATGLNFPDALTGSVLAAKNDAPILLVRPDNIPSATEQQLPTYRGFSIFGGTGVVSEDVKGMLR